MKTTRSLRGLAIVGLLFFGFFNLAQAQTLPVDVDIAIDPDGISILNFYSEVDVIIHPVSLAEVQNRASAPRWPASPNARMAPARPVLPRLYGASPVASCTATLRSR